MLGWKAHRSLHYFKYKALRFHLKFPSVFSSFSHLSCLPASLRASASYSSLLSSPLPLLLLRAAAISSLFPASFNLRLLAPRSSVLEFSPQRSHPNYACVDTLFEPGLMLEGSASAYAS